MDDLNPMPNAEQALSPIRDLSYMLAKRGFNLIKYIGIFPEIPRKLNLEKDIEVKQETLVNTDSSS